MLVTGQVKITGVGCSPCLALPPQGSRDAAVLGQGGMVPATTARSGHAGSLSDGGCLPGHPRACRAGEWQSGALYPRKGSLSPSTGSHVGHSQPVEITVEEHHEVTQASDVLGGKKK